MDRKNLFPIFGNHFFGIFEILLFYSSSREDKLNTHEYLGHTTVHPFPVCSARAHTLFQINCLASTNKIDFVSYFFHSKEIMLAPFDKLRMIGENAND